MKREPTADAVRLHERASASPSPISRDERQSPAEPFLTIPEHLTLRQHQEWFARIITTPESQLIPIDETSALRLVAPSARLAASARLEIYRRSYHARLVECLVDDYSVLQHALGDEAFEALCRAYIARHPSADPNLNAFGQHMAVFCRAQPPPGVDAQFAADLATLEWAIVETIHAPTATPLTTDDFGAVPTARWGDVRLIPNPSLKILRFEYPVNAYLQAQRQGGAPDLPIRQASFVAVFRTGLTVWRMELGPVTVVLFELLVGGAPLAQALEKLEPLLRDTSNPAERVMAWFNDGVSSGLFSGLELAD